MANTPMLDPNDRSATVEDWWNYHHEGKGSFRLWLTGNPGSDVWRYLNVGRFIRRGATVLNIGVGLGYCTKRLAGKGCVVHALDISPVALRRVEPFTARTWLPSALPELPERTFDLAISNLVTQHMGDPELKEQLSGVLRALKPEGVFAMQFAFSRDGSANDRASVPDVAMKTGAVYRSLAGMATLVERAGGLIVWSRRIGLFSAYNSGWYAVHIVRADHPFVNTGPSRLTEGFELWSDGQSPLRIGAERAARAVVRRLLRMLGKG